MLFKRKKDEARRMRQPNLQGGAGAQPVFSYHARSSRTEADGTRQANKLLWLSPSKPSKPLGRPPMRSLTKRVLAASAVVLAAALLLNGLFLSRDPEVVAADLAPSQQALLRNVEEYRAGARELLSGSLANANKVTIDTGKVAKAMLAMFPELGEVAVELPIVGRQPTFHIRPVTPALLLKANGEVFVIDMSGRAAARSREAPKAAKLGLPVAEDHSGLPLTLGEAALPSDDVAFIQEVVGQLRAKKLAVLSMVLPRGTSELDVRVEGVPYFVKFNLRGDARAEAGAFLAAKQHLERENKAPSSYIDVRVDNKVYFR